VEFLILTVDSMEAPASVVSQRSKPCLALVKLNTIIHEKRLKKIKILREN